MEQGKKYVYGSILNGKEPWEIRIYIPGRAENRRHSSGSAGFDGRGRNGKFGSR
jgi:hypothetical protein